MKKIERVKHELETIARKHNGLCIPEEVVKVAKNKDSILHDYFEWDNTKASHLYRLWQARKLIVTIRYEPYEEKEAVQYFVSLVSDRKTSGYRIISDVMSDEEMRMELLKEALDMMLYFKKKYSILTELTKIFIEIEKTTEQLKKQS